MMVNRVLWTVFGSIFLVMALGWSAFDLVGLWAHDEFVVEHHQPAAGITTLLVRSDGGSVQVRRAETDEITVTAVVSRGLFATEQSAEVVGEVYEVRDACPDGPDPWCSVDYEITVPRDLVVDARSEDGRVTVDPAP